MSVTDSTIAMLERFTLERLRSMPEGTRRRLQGQCDRILREMIVLDAVGATETPRSGVLLALNRGQSGHS